MAEACVSREGKKCTKRVVKNINFQFFSSFLKSKIDVIPIGKILIFKTKKLLRFFLSRLS